MLFGSLFILLGNQIIITKVLTAIVLIINPLIIYYISIKILYRARLLPYILSFIWLGGFYYYGNTVVYGLMFALLSGYYLFNYFETKKDKWFYFAGITIGLTAVFRHEMGAYLFGAIYQAIFFFNLSNEKVINEKKWIKVKFGLKKASIFGLFTLAPLPLAIYLISNINFIDLWNSLIIWPFTIYREFESTSFLFLSNDPLESLKALVFYTPLIILIFSIVSIIRRTRRKTLELNGVKFWKEMTLFNLGINLFNHTQVISDVQHAMPAMIVAGILLFYHINRIKYRFIFSFIVLIILCYFPYEFRLNTNHLVENDYKEIINEYKHKSILSISTIDYNNNNFIYYLNDKKPIKYYIMQKGISDSLYKNEFKSSIQTADILLAKRNENKESSCLSELKFIQEELNKLKLIDSTKHFFIYTKN